MKIASSLINQRIEIYRDEDIPNSSGGMIPNTVLYWATNARVEQLSRSRDTGQDSEIYKPSYRFTINDRIDKTVLPNMLIKYRDAWFTITDYQPSLVYNEQAVINAVSSSTLNRRIPALNNIGYWWLSDEGDAPLTASEIITKNPFTFSDGGVIKVTFTEVVFKVLNIAYPSTQTTITTYTNANELSDFGNLGGISNLLGSAKTTGNFKQHNGNYLVNGNKTLIFSA